MFMHHWSVGLARVYALQAMEQELQRAREGRSAEPPRRLRQAAGRALRALGQGLAGLGERLAHRPAAKSEPLCL